MSILDNVQPVYQTTNHSRLVGVTPDIAERMQRVGSVGGLDKLPQAAMQSWSSTGVNKSASFGNVAAAYQGQGDDAVKGSVAAAERGWSVAQDAIANANNQVSRINMFANQAGQSAGNISGAITNVNAAAGDVRNIAGALTPYANQLNTWGQDVYGQGLNLYNQGQQYLTGGSDIMNMNADAGGLTGAYIKALQAIDPDRYVAGAASDTQSAFSNAMGQMQRGLARQGVDASSGRGQAMMRQWAQAAAAALAGAKTRARQVGITERLKALDAGTATARELAATGTNIQGAGMNAQAAGGSMLKGAADVIGTQGQLTGTAGQLYGTAGQLSGTQANAYTNAGQLSQGAGQLGVQAGQLGVNAAGQVADAQMKAGMYYAQVAQGYGQLAGSGGLANALFGNNTSSSAPTIERIPNSMYMG